MHMSYFPKYHIHFISILITRVPSLASLTGGVYPSVAPDLTSLVEGHVFYFVCPFLTPLLRCWGCDTTGLVSLLVDFCQRIPLAVIQVVYLLRFQHEPVYMVLLCFWMAILTWIGVWYFDLITLCCVYPARQKAYTVKWCCLRLNHRAYFTSHCHVFITKVRCHKLVTYVGGFNSSHVE